MARKNAPEVLTRAASMHAGRGLQLFICPYQKAKPDWSGNRERKSTYCCCTKKSASSIVMGTFVPGRSLIGLTFVLPYIKSEGRRLPSSETMRSVGACWLCASAAAAERPTKRAAAMSLRILLLQKLSGSCRESATKESSGGRRMSIKLLSGAGLLPSRLLEV